MTARRTTISATATAVVLLALVATLLLVTVPTGGEYRVDATTAAGDVSVDGVVRNDRALRSISATADAGDVTVRGRKPSPAS